MTQPADTDAPLDNYLRRARAAGIDRTVIFAAFSDVSSCQPGGGEDRRARSPPPPRFRVRSSVADKGRVDSMVREAVGELGLVGIKVHRHDARITREICDAGRRYRVPILYDVMGEVSVAGILAEEYPDVAFIIPHLGSFADDWRAQTALIDHLVRHPNIFTDTAGVRRFDLLEQAVRRAGARKILFGTDGPWLHPAVEIAKIYALNLTPQEQGAVLGGNLMRLIGRRASSGRSIALRPPSTTHIAASAV